MHKIGIAALTTVLVYSTFIFLYYGSVMFLLDGSLAFNSLMLLDLFLAFLFLVSIFWVHTRISSLMTLETFDRLHPMLKAFMEGALVIASTLALLSLVFYFPLHLLFPDVYLPPGRLRTVAVVSTIISLFFYYFVEREQSQKKFQVELLRSAQLQQENFKAQLQSLKNQVDPHFLFNSLNVLRSLIRKDQDQAEEFVLRLSDIYRSFLDHSHELLVPLHQEMELVQAYLYLLSARFGDNLRFKTDVSEEFMNLLLPPGSLQMLIENAIKHNGSTSQKPLLICIYTEENKLVVKNKLQPRLESVQSTKTGLNNITSRYRYLTDEVVDIVRTSEEFIVKLPLLTMEEDESANH